MIFKKMQILSNMVVCLGSLTQIFDKWTAFDNVYGSMLFERFTLVEFL